MDRFELLEIIRYYAPYLSTVERELLAEKNESHNSLIQRMHSKSRYADYDVIEHCACYSASESCMCMEAPREPLTDEEEMHRLLEEFNATVSRMKAKGVDVEFLHELLDKGDVISKLFITDDLRILLPDYGNMEIEMPALPKTVYLFFLLHPEGIVLKTLEDYKTELYNIYRQVKPCGDEAKAHVTITNLINPVNNNMNEKLSQIKTFINRVFTAQMDQRLAKHYYIEGEKGGLYRLALDRNLIEFEE